MSIWAIADLHLSFGVQNKNMDIFGPQWKQHAAKIAEAWHDQIKQEDLVLIAGDISWAMRPQEASADLQWIDALPGTKVLLRGNHDYWWNSYTKVKAILPPSIIAIHNNAWKWNEVAIGGARLWDTSEYNFGSVIQFRENPVENKIKSESTNNQDEQEKIFQRELNRLEFSLSQMSPDASLRIAMTHYPPIGLDLAPSQSSKILEKHKIDICVFGHLHSIPPHHAPFGTARGVRYCLTSCDYLDFKPLLIV